MNSKHGKFQSIIPVVEVRMAVTSLTINPSPEAPNPAGRAMLTDMVVVVIIVINMCTRSLGPKT